MLSLGQLNQMSHITYLSLMYEMLKCMNYFKRAAHITANANPDYDSYVFRIIYQWVAAQLTQNPGLNSLVFRLLVKYLTHKIY